MHPWYLKPASENLRLSIVYNRSQRLYYKRVVGYSKATALRVCTFGYMIRFDLNGLKPGDFIPQNSCRITRFFRKSYIYKTERFVLQKIQKGQLEEIKPIYCVCYLLCKISLGPL